MPAATDLLLDENYDLAFSPGGDLAVGESDAQHIDLLLRTSQGEWRATPLVGIGLLRYLLSPYGPAQAGALSREVGVQLVQDGYQVLELDLADLSTATINAERP
jgi:hypothetical protein